MTQKIVIDTNTEVGYSYIKKMFFVTNEGTTTYRTTSIQAKQILDIVAPGNTVTQEQIEELSTTLEDITSLSYTWEDTGKYIKTIQINDYAEYPLTLDCEKNKLYIMNTTLIFDLTTSENREDRINYLCDYYETHMGLNISKEDMLSLYDLFINFYKPCVYNEVDVTITTPLTYNNIFKLSNFTGRSVATYTCTNNPNAKYTDTFANFIIATDVDENSITLSALPSASIEVGKEIKITGTEVKEENYTYSNDGTYTVASIDTTNYKIFTNSNIPYSYSYAYPTGSLVSSKTNIASINRDTSVITLTSDVPNSITTGDIIYVSGTAHVSDYETVDCDGTYTVVGVSGATLTVQEQPAISYTYSSGTYPYVSKRLPLGDIKNISSTTKVIEFTKTLPYTPVAGSTVIVTSADKVASNNYTVTAVSSDTITVSESIEGYSPVYPQVLVPIPSTEIAINVTETKKPLIMPEGTFIVDNFTQCKSYISTCTGLTVPPDAIYALVTKPIPTTREVIDPTTGEVSETLPTMNLVGLYSQVYKEETSD